MSLSVACKLLRVDQWYKNLVIFIPLIFGAVGSEIDLFLDCFIGFISLCFISSGNYIINDIKDKSKDQSHPSKKHRPIASSNISTYVAVAISFMLITIGLFSAYYVDATFFVLACVLLALSICYTFILKQFFLMGVMSISLGFMIRVLSGIPLAKVVPSPWLLLCPMLLALFIVLAKRKYDIMVSNNFPTNWKNYKSSTIDSYVIISATLLLISYALYAVLTTDNPGMIITLPFALGLVMKHMQASFQKFPESGNPALWIKSTGMVVSIIAWFLLSLLVVYQPEFISLILHL